MVRLAMKAFHPGPLPFPLLHIDTGWKFRDMIAFRDAFCREHGLRLIVHTNDTSGGAGAQSDHRRQQDVDGRHEDAGAAPGAHRRRLRRGVRRGAARRGEVARQGARLLVPRPLPPVGSEEPAARALEPATTARSTRARASACSRCRTGPSSTSGSTCTSSTFRSCRSISPSAAPDRRARRQSDHGRRRAAAAPARRAAADARGAVPDARLLPVQRRRGVDRRRRCPKSSRRCCSPGRPSGRAA